MAIVTIYLPAAQVDPGEQGLNIVGAVGAQLRKYYICDTEAEKNGLTGVEGDFVYVKATKKLHVWNGMWSDALSGSILGYAEDVNSYSTAPPRELCPVTVVVDGIMTVEVEAFVPSAGGSQSGTDLHVDLYDTTLDAYLGKLVSAVGVSSFLNVHRMRRYIPSTGSHTWVIRVDVSGGIWGVNADDGNALGEYGPMWLQVRRG
jgi:hypothetical protein